MEKHLFTVFTPTHNRVDLLPRVYDCLLKQTFKDFKWLIIANESNDGTTELVEKWKKEAILDIEYIWQKNRGKTGSMKRAYESCDTKYLVSIDDDDTLTEDCLQSFYNEWRKIENENVSKIGCIRALTIGDDGLVVGGSNTLIGIPPVDSDYLKVHFVDQCLIENVSCWLCSALHEVNMFQYDSNWRGMQITYVSEVVFWSRFARHYKTRYIYLPLRIYTYTEESITRGKKKNLDQRYHNSSYTKLLIINENSDYLGKIALYKYIILYLAYSMYNNLVSYQIAVKEMNHHRFFAYLCYPIVWCLVKYLKH